MNQKLVGIFVLAISSLAPLAVRAEITAERTDKNIEIKIDGKPFTEYHPQAGHSPSMYPLIGPSGKAVTRSYPFTPPTADGTKDHPHHQSFWFTHDKVNGINFWAANKNDDLGDSGAHIAQREFVDISSGKTARIVTKNDWMDGTKRVCEDQRTI